MAFASINAPTGADEWAQKTIQRRTREAAEAKLITTYHRGMEAFRSGDLAGAKEMLTAVLDETEGAQSTGDDGGNAPAGKDADRQHDAKLSVPLKLRTLALRNLGEIYEIHWKKGRAETAGSSEGRSGPLSDGDGEEDYRSRALRSYAEAVHIDSGRDLALICKMGRLALDMGKDNVARRCFEHGLCIRPSHPILPELLMKVLVRVGDVHEGRLAAKMILAKKPNHAGAREALDPDAKADGTERHRLPSTKGDVSGGHVASTTIEIGGAISTWLDVVRFANDGLSRCFGCEAGTSAEVQPVHRRERVRMVLTAQPDEKTQNEKEPGASVAGERPCGTAAVPSSTTSDADKDGRKQGVISAEGRVKSSEQLQGEAPATRSDSDPATAAKASGGQVQREPKQGTRQSSRQSKKTMGSGAFESFSQRDDNLQQKIASLTSMDTSEVDARLREFTDDARQISGGDKMKDRLQSCRAAGTLTCADTSDVGISSPPIRAHEIDAFMSCYGEEWSCFEEFGSSLFEFISEDPSCLAWNPGTVSVVLRLEHELRHWASQTSPGRTIRACMFAAELNLTEIERTRDTSTLALADTVAGAGYVFNTGLLSSKAAANGYPEALWKDVEARFYRCSALWAKFRGEYELCELYLEMTKPHLRDIDGGDALADACDLPHCGVSMHSRAIEEELSTVRRDVMLLRAQEQPDVLKSVSQIRDLSNVVFGGGFCGVDRFLMAIVNLKADSMSALKILSAAEARVNGLEHELQSSDRAFLQFVGLRAQARILMSHVLRELEGGAGTIGKEKKTKSTDNASKRGGSQTRVLELGRNAELLVSQIMHMRSDEGRLADVAALITDAVRLELDALTSSLLEFFVDSWGNELAPGASNSRSKTSDVKLVHATVADAILAMHGIFLNSRGTEEHSDLKLRRLFGALHDCLGSVGLCTARGCSFLRLGVSLLNSGRPAFGVGGPDAVHQAIYCMFGVPLCDRKLLCEHGASHSKFKSPKESTSPGDDCLPPASAAIEAWPSLEEYVLGILGADEKFHRKKDIFSVVSPTLELIAEHEDVKAEINIISAKLAEYIDDASLSDDALEESRLLSLVENANASLAGLRRYFYMALWESRNVLQPLEYNDPWDLLTDGVENLVERAPQVIRADLAFNPMRFTSWVTLGRLYDDAADLMMNDGSKLVPLSQWRSFEVDGLAVEERWRVYKRRSLRCWLRAHKISRTDAERETAEELLGMLYFEKCQHLYPTYSNRGTKWTSTEIEENGAKAKMYFEDAADKNDKEWTYRYYLGKLALKMDEEPERVLQHFREARWLSPDKLEPFYRLHATRLKYLLTIGDDVYQRNELLVDKRLLLRDMYIQGRFAEESAVYLEVEVGDDEAKEILNHLGAEGKVVLKDCLLAMERCLEIGHFYKARYRLAKTYVALGARKKAFEMMSFIFKQKSGAFDINMFEIGEDILTGAEKKRIRNRSNSRQHFKTANGNLVGPDEIRQVGVEEPSRKFVGAVRRLCLFYFRLCCELGELDTLNSAISWISSKSGRVRHGLGNIVEDLGPLVETMYIHALYARHAALTTMATVDEIESDEDGNDLRMVAMHGDEMQSILSRCFHVYLQIYNREAIPSSHFATMVSAMDTSIANDEIGWFFRFRHEVANLSEVSFEMFLCTASYEYVDLVSDCTTLRSLISAVQDTPVDKLAFLPLCQKGLIMAVVERAFEVGHDVYLSISENSNASAGVEAEAHELMLTCKMLRDVYFGKLADLFKTDSNSSPEVSRVEELLVRTYALCISSHGDRMNFKPCLSSALSFCDGLQKQKSNAPTAPAGAAVATAPESLANKRTLQDANDSEPSMNEIEGDRLTKRTKPGDAPPERSRRAIGIE